MRAHVRSFLLSVAVTCAAACTEEVPIDDMEDMDEDAADEIATCEELPRGPFTPKIVLQGLVGSEDLAFDTKGRVAGRVQGSVLLVTSKAKTTQVAGQLAG